MTDGEKERGRVYEVANQTLQCCGHGAHLVMDTRGDQTRHEISEALIESCQNNLS